MNIAIKKWLILIRCDEEDAECITRNDQQTLFNIQEALLPNLFWMILKIS